LVRHRVWIDDAKLAVDLKYKLSRSSITDAMQAVDMLASSLRPGPSRSNEKWDDVLVVSSKLVLLTNLEG